MNETVLRVKQALEVQTSYTCYLSIADIAELWEMGYRVDIVEIGEMFDLCTVRR